MQVRYPAAAGLATPQGLSRRSDIVAIQPPSAAAATAITQTPSRPAATAIAAKPSVRTRKRSPSARRWESIAAKATIRPVA